MDCGAKRFEIESKNGIYEVTAPGVREAQLSDGDRSLSYSSCLVTKKLISEDKYWVRLLHGERFANDAANSRLKPTNSGEILHSHSTFFFQTRCEVATRQNGDPPLDKNKVEVKTTEVFCSLWRLRSPWEFQSKSEGRVPILENPAEKPPRLPIYVH